MVPNRHTCTLHSTTFVHNPPGMCWYASAQHIVCFVIVTNTRRLHRTWKKKPCLPFHDCFPFQSISVLNSHCLHVKCMHTHLSCLCIFVCFCHCCRRLRRRCCRRYWCLSFIRMPHTLYTLKQRQSAYIQQYIVTNTNHWLTSSAKHELNLCVVQFFSLFVWVVKIEPLSCVLVFQNVCFERDQLETFSDCGFKRQDVCYCMLYFHLFIRIYFDVETVYTNWLTEYWGFPRHFFSVSSSFYCFVCYCFCVCFFSRKKKSKSFPIQIVKKKKTARIYISVNRNYSVRISNVVNIDGETAWIHCTIYLTVKPFEI